MSVFSWPSLLNLPVLAPTRTERCGTSPLPPSRPTPSVLSRSATATSAPREEAPAVAALSCAASGIAAPASIRAIEPAHRDTRYRIAHLDQMRWLDSPDAR